MKPASGGGAWQKAFIIGVRRKPANTGNPSAPVTLPIQNTISVPARPRKPQAKSQNPVPKPARKQTVTKKQKANAQQPMPKPKKRRKVKRRIFHDSSDGDESDSNDSDSTDDQTINQISTAGRGETTNARSQNPG